MTRAKDISKIVTDADLSGTLDVTGTVTAGGNVGINESNPSSSLHIYGSSPKITLEHSNENGTAQIYTTSQSGIILDADPDNTDNGTPIQLKTDGKARLLVEDSGDISFYEDTGTTPKLFWDASAERLGIGTSSPSYKLDVDVTGSALRLNSTTSQALLVISSDDSSNAKIEFGDESDNDRGAITYDNPNNAMIFQTNTSERMRIDSSGNVGIGTSSPAFTLEVNKGSAGDIARFTDGVNANTVIKTSGSVTTFGPDTNNSLALQTNNTERMRIDANGHVTMPYQSAFLVTKTTTRANKPSSGDETVVYETEVFDQNSDISSNTFTAPVTGKYQFNATVRLDEVDTASAYVRIRINTSNRVYVNIIDPNFSADLSYITLNISVLADMDASDTAIVEVGQSGGAAQMDLPGNAQYQQFSGYLVA